jgi:hypothetical protein
MIWVGSFKSLQSALPEPRSTDAPLAVHTWVRSEIGLITPLVDWLMILIAGSICVFGEEESVELALREALNNSTHSDLLVKIDFFQQRVARRIGNRSRYSQRLILI